MGIVIKKFNKNNTPQSQIEESYNYNESLNVGNANGVRQDIIIKRDRESLWKPYNNELPYIDSRNLSEPIKVETESTCCSFQHVCK